MSLTNWVKTGGLGFTKQPDCIHLFNGNNGLAFVLKGVTVTEVGVDVSPPLREGTEKKDVGMETPE